MRCFVAAFVAAASAQRLMAAYRRQFPLADADAHGSRARPAARRDLPAETYHVTLRFFGEVAEDRLPDLIRRLEAIDGPGNPSGLGAAEPLRVSVEGFAGLPGARRARLAAALVTDHPILSAWAAALAGITLPDAAPEDPPRPFRPHVTVSRFRRPRHFPTRGLSDGAEGAPEALTLVLDPPGLYRSETLPGGARYTRISPP